MKKRDMSIYQMDWVTRAQAAAILQLSIRQIDNLRDAGRLEANKISPKCVRISMRSIEKLKEGLA